jgi:hypothetical protein
MQQFRRLKLSKEPISSIALRLRNRFSDEDDSNRIAVPAPYQGVAAERSNVISLEAVKIRKQAEKLRNRFKD